MLIQLVLGSAADSEGVRRHWERWHHEVAPGAPGWQRSTGGVTADGRLVLAVFLEAAAGRSLSANIDAYLHGPPTVFESDDVHEVRISDPSRAGFVQAMRGSVRDRDRFEAVEHTIGPAFVAHRPDFLAGYRIWLEDGSMVALDYFSSEAAARAGETKALPDALAAGFGEWQSLVDTGNAEWYDLTDPWIAAPD